MDERSSAFFALGLAKSTQTPVVVISTSGTAPANFFPAIIEASLSRVPMIIISADRPGHFVGTGANQTINQEELYGIHVRYFNDTGLPTEHLDALEQILQQAINHTSKGDKIMVILDSNHTHEHVLKELELYSILVSKAQYLVVMDTVVDDMPDDYFSDRPWGKGDNPKTAVHEFLKSNDRFEIDDSIHNKLLITVAPDGYLRCIK